MPPKGGKGKKKIEIEYIEDKQRRASTRTKRIAGIMKKLQELFLLSQFPNIILYESGKPDDIYDMLGLQDFSKEFIQIYHKYRENTTHDTFND